MAQLLDLAFKFGNGLFEVEKGRHAPCTAFPVESGIYQLSWIPHRRRTKIAEREQSPCQGSRGALGGFDLLGLAHKHLGLADRCDVDEFAVERDRSLSLAL